MLPEGVKEVGEFTFYGCKDLRSAVLNEGLETLGPRAFSRTGLESLVLPATLKELEDSFAGCESLRTISLPTGELNVSYDKESNDYSGKLVVSSGARELPFHPAYNCFGLAEVTFEEDCKLERIGPNVFQNTQLESFAAPASLREVGWMAFGNCQRLQNLTLNEGLEKVGNHCFWMTQVRQL